MNDLSLKIAQQLYLKAAQIKTVEDMATIIRESVAPLEQELADIYDKVDDLPGGGGFLHE
jgi:hypothetical protein